jgi:hypothetical protein
MKKLYLYKLIDGALVLGRKREFLPYLAIIATVVLLVDSSIVRISDFLPRQPSQSWQFFLFVFIGSIISLMQIFILLHTKYAGEESLNKKKLNLVLVYRVASNTQYALILIVILIIFQMSFRGYYNIFFLIAAIAVSYLLSVAMQSILAKRFLHWFKLNRSPVVFFYFLSSAALLFNSIVSMLLVNTILYYRPSTVVPHIGTAHTTIIAGSTMDTLNAAYVFSSVVMFILIWIATSLLLVHYSKKIGRTKFWILIALPLVYFLSPFSALYLNFYGPFFDINPILFLIVFTLIFNFSPVVGGTLFGIALWAVTRRLDKNNPVKNYLVISAFGFIIFFVSNQPMIISSAPFPPFGIASIISVGFSSYMILVGIYSSAIHVSVDAELRRSIRKLALEEPNLLDTIGSAQMEEEIMGKVTRIMKIKSEFLDDQKGTESELSQDELKDYMKKVLKELKNDKAG